MGYIFDIHLAKSYEDWSRSSRGLQMESFVEKMISKTLKPFKHESVLDIGCGSGNHLLLAARLGMDITGIDASPYMISLAKNRLGNRCELKKANAEDIPYEDNTFDLAFFINTLEYLDDPLSALKEAGRVTKRGILIVFFNSYSRYCRWKKIGAAFKSNLFSYTHTYSLWEIKSFINKAYGAVPIKWQSEYLFPAFFNKTGIPLIFRNIPMPFGYLIGISVTLKYRYKTDNLFLKEKLGRNKSPVMEGIQISHSK
ncbi:MAG: class I SAM-dependent methyltransferase [Deltaproteobacteria bacterium]|nr:class I SAM-dependent methyltransferase [Deltaproteobacteria bacterium]